MNALQMHDRLNKCIFVLVIAFIGALIFLTHIAPNNMNNERHTKRAKRVKITNPNDMNDNIKRVDNYNEEKMSDDKNMTQMEPMINDKEVISPRRVVFDDESLPNLHIGPWAEDDYERRNVSNLTNDTQFKFNKKRLTLKNHVMSTQSPHHRRNVNVTSYFNNINPNLQLSNVPLLNSHFDSHALHPHNHNRVNVNHVNSFTQYVPQHNNPENNYRKNNYNYQNNHNEHYQHQRNYAERIDYDYDTTPETEGYKVYGNRVQFPTQTPLSPPPEHQNVGFRRPMEEPKQLRGFYDISNFDYQTQVPPPLRFITEKYDSPNDSPEGHDNYDDFEDSTEGPERDYEFTTPFDENLRVYNSRVKDISDEIFKNSQRPYQMTTQFPFKDEDYEFTPFSGPNDYTTESPDYDGFTHSNYQPPSVYNYRHHNKDNTNFPIATPQPIIGQLNTNTKDQFPQFEMERDRFRNFHYQRPHYQNVRNYVTQTPVQNLMNVFTPKSEVLSEYHTLILPMKITYQSNMTSPVMRKSVEHIMSNS